MTIEEVIRNRIVNDEALAAVLGERVFPVHIPDHEYEKPWAMYRVDESTAETDLEGEITSSVHNVRIDVLADSYAEALSIEKKLNSALHTTADDPRPVDPVHAIHFTRSAKSPRDEGFQVEIDYTVHANGDCLFA